MAKLRGQIHIEERKKYYIVCNFIETLQNSQKRYYHSSISSLMELKIIFYRIVIIINDMELLTREKRPQWKIRWYFTHTIFCSSLYHKAFDVEFYILISFPFFYAYIKPSLGMYVSQWQLNIQSQIISSIWLKHLSENHRNSHFLAPLFSLHSISFILINTTPTLNHLLPNQSQTVFKYFVGTRKNLLLLGRTRARRIQQRGVRGSATAAWPRI